MRAGYVYNTWPLIDGRLMPGASALFFDIPLWRNFFENTLTVQFDHRMLAYVILLCALLHALDVARRVKRGPARTSALVVGAFVALQVVLGVATLLLVVPLAVALAHQALAMLILTAATVHAMNLVGQTRRAAPLVGDGLDLQASASSKPPRP